MSRYDGLIIPRSYSDYINKTDAATLSQALQLSGVMDAAPTAQSTKPAKSGGIFAANAVIMADSATLSGVAISAGSVVRVLFTAALTGSDATTGLTLTYNGTAYAVKVGKDGALEALTAHLVEESYIYLQAYTTLELAFDGSQFVVMGNPVVISNADFSIMADGSSAYNKHTIDTAYASKDRSIYYQATGNYLLLILASELILPRDEENIIFVKAVDKNNPTDFWEGFFKFTPNTQGSAVANISYTKTNGNGTILAINAQGTIQFSFYAGDVEVCAYRI